ncbi:hypothetical protein L1987_46709 [Smallanthus sonchifolius]|uniref:Uncharacterized protein n=1 Tax=Smallanthus sonchifolius TaxID=185202 RepID=A0ACB9G0D6_9ASTR|nr:hypothetical protein L1987_46709 [Smallanthus sonchifolius]
MEPWCEICGGDHWVQDCYYSQVDTHHGCEFIRVDPEKRKREVEVILAHVESQRQKPHTRMVYDQMGNFFGFEDSSGHDTRTETTCSLEPAQSPFSQSPSSQSPSSSYFDHEGVDDTYLIASSSMNDSSFPFYMPHLSHLSWEDDCMQDSKFEDMHEDEFVADDIEEEFVPSLLDEFGEEFVNSERETEESPHHGEAEKEEGETEEEGEQEEVVEEPEQPLHVKDSQHVEERDGGSPPQSTRPRDRAKRRMDRHVLRVLRWSHRDHRRIPYSRDDRLPHYMPHLRFGPAEDSSVFIPSSRRLGTGTSSTSYRYNTLSGENHCEGYESCMVRVLKVGETGIGLWITVFHSIVNGETDRRSLIWHFSIVYPVLHMSLLVFSGSRNIPVSVFLVVLCLEHLRIGSAGDYLEEELNCCGIVGDLCMELEMGLVASCKVISASGAVTNEDLVEQVKKMFTKLS